MLKEASVSNLEVLISRSGWKLENEIATGLGSLLQGCLYAILIELITRSSV